MSKSPSRQFGTSRPSGTPRPGEAPRQSGTSRQFGTSRPGEVRRPGEAPRFLSPLSRPLFRPLFGPADPLAQAALGWLPEVLDELMPLSRAHRADLPDAIRELSAALTTERDALSRYWSAPRFVSAYLRYFLPWNLVRLARLLPGLDLPTPPPAVALALEGGEGTSTDLAGKSENPSLTILDLGSGPLTLPLALWLSRPDWRATALTLICADTSPRPMELGRRLLELVAARAGVPLVWRIRLLRAPFQRALRETPAPRLIMAGNVLNEVQDKGGEILSDRMEELARTLAFKSERSPESRALFVEPGTRLGGVMTASLREAALEAGLTPIAPCTHSEDCPLLGRRSRGWCHATQDAGGPPWLAALSKAAGLPKDSLSLSFMLLSSQGPHPSYFPELQTGLGVQNSAKGALAKEILAGRILSDAFPVPGMGHARYACTAEGLAILPDAGSLPSGSVVACRQSEPPRRDAKSGALELHWLREIVSPLENGKAAAHDKPVESDKPVAHDKPAERDKPVGHEKRVAHGSPKGRPAAKPDQRREQPRDQKDRATGKTHSASRKAAPQARKKTFRRES